MNYSPLRYPGGKSKITKLVKTLMDKAGIVKGTYIEPFAGGSGVALTLLFNGDVEKIVINDIDLSIYSFWYAVLNETENLICKIRNTEISIEEWNRQKEVYVNQSHFYSLDLAFATFYLNRTNRSGILKAGPIGGAKQDGEYLIDARFKKDRLIDRIEKIAHFKDKISLYNLDIFQFLNDIVPTFDNNSFIYFDPPYFKKGKELYTNFFNYSDHKNISEALQNVNIKWMITYDDTSEIENLYQSNFIKRFDINYSLASKKKNSEIIALSNNFWPVSRVLAELDFNIR